MAGKLSAKCWQNVGKLLANCWPIVGIVMKNIWQIIGKLFINFSKFLPNYCKSVGKLFAIFFSIIIYLFKNQHIINILYD